VQSTGDTCVLDQHRSLSLGTPRLMLRSIGTDASIRHPRCQGLDHKEQLPETRGNIFSVVHRCCRTRAIAYVRDAVNLGGTIPMSVRPTHI
jgi:hypothetical protein